jgi:hypothetical protein
MELARGWIKIGVQTCIKTNKKWEVYVNRRSGQYKFVPLEASHCQN